MENERIEFEKNWDVFVLTGMPWHEIKSLSSFDRDSIYAKSVEAKNKTLEQIKARDAFYASQGLGPDGKTPLGA
jgi:hypothetical protein